MLQEKKFYQMKKSSIIEESFNDFHVNLINEGENAIENVCTIKVISFITENLKRKESACLN